MFLLDHWWCLSYPALCAVRMYLLFHALLLHFGLTQHSVICNVLFIWGCSYLVNLLRTRSLIWSWDLVLSFCHDCNLCWFLIGLHSTFQGFNKIWCLFCKFIALFRVESVNQISWLLFLVSKSMDWDSQNTTNEPMLYQ